MWTCNYQLMDKPAGTQSTDWPFELIRISLHRWPLQINCHNNNVTTKECKRPLILVITIVAAELSLIARGQGCRRWGVRQQSGFDNKFIGWCYDCYNTFQFQIDQLMLQIRPQQFTGARWPNMVTLYGDLMDTTRCARCWLNIRKMS